jgi:hypothetical protein
VVKTEGALQERARRLAWLSGVATIVFISVVSFATLYLDPPYFDRWMSWPNILFVAPVPILLGTMAVLLFRSLVIDHRTGRPVLLALRGCSSRCSACCSGRERPRRARSGACWRAVVRQSPGRSPVNLSVLPRRMRAGSSGFPSS